MTADISRNFADPGKFFRSVARQQGRLPTDAEENHSEEIATWTHDAEFSDTITPLGTPDDGFKIVVPAGVHNSFQILPGSFYLGGARLENPAEIAYAGQVGDNWLTQDAPITPNARILAWLECEERMVTAVQDAELLEPALRGADGSGRTRMCWRVRQAATAAETCSAALAGILGADLAALVDPETGAIASTGTLTIDFDNAGDDLDLCKPAIEAGYLGNRNQCYRVKRTGAGRFVWGEDNGAQLYRVTIDADGTTVRFLTEPKDEFLRPKAGMTVELLRGDVKLPNYERVAEPNGEYRRVSGGYSNSAITLATAVPAAWLTWLPSVPVDPDISPAPPRHFYLRVWTGGGEAGQPDVPFTAGVAKSLTGTGLTVQFDGTTIAGDSWSIAARPDSPTRVLPWALQKGMRAHGRRRHVVPLGIVDLATGVVKDCRPRFRPLYKIRSCCTVLVGEPGSRQGDVDSIAAGLALLPAEGGTLCLLAGTHRANVTLTGRTNIRFTGCPGLTRWLATDATLPLANLLDSTDISFHDIIFESGEAPAIVAGKSDPFNQGIANGSLTIEDCVFRAPAGCAVYGRALAGAKLLGCRVEAGPFPVAPPAGGAPALPAVFLQGEGLHIAGNDIVAPLGAQDAPTRRALGGIQIGGDSQRVRILDNRIREGAGIGITLGSVMLLVLQTTTYAANPVTAAAEGQAEAAQAYAASEAPWYAAPFTYSITAGGCGGLDPQSPDPSDNGDGTITIPVSEGPVEHVRIERNLVRDMGHSGIATYPMGVMLAAGGAAVDAVAVTDLTVADNRILDNVKLEIHAPNDLLRIFSPYGGIALSVANDALFRGNEIAGNGTVQPDATCGIGILYGEDIRVEDNRIERNGMHGAKRIAFGPNAGLSVTLAIGGMSGFAAAAETRKSDRPALFVHGNTITAPAGRAIRALAIGPVIVNDNRLTGGNPSRLFTGLAETLNQIQELLPDLRDQIGDISLILLDLIVDLVGGDAVNIVNLAMSEDLFTIMVAGLYKPDAGGAGDDATFKAYLAFVFAANAWLLERFPTPYQRGGETMFANNQVSLRRPEPGGPLFSVSSIFITSLDDIGFTDNQYEAEANRGLVVYDVMLIAVTLRTISNRGQEAALCWRSIFSFGVLWNTTGLNQTTAPIQSLSITSMSPPPTADISAF